MMLPWHRVWLLTGALLGGLAVACGALGAHGLKSSLEADGQFTPADRDRLANWETAARYQMYHSLALVLVGVLAARRRGLAIHLAGTAMTLGTLIFSGCLYLLVLTGQRWLGAVVPIGGVLMMVGWLCLVVAALGEPGAAAPAGGD